MRSAQFSPPALSEREMPAHESRSTEPPGDGEDVDAVQTDPDASGELGTRELLT